MIYDSRYISIDESSSFRIMIKLKLDISVQNNVPCTYKIYDEYEN